MTSLVVPLWAVIGLLAYLILESTTARLFGAVPQLPYRVAAAPATSMIFAAIAWRHSTTTDLVVLSIFAAVGVQLAVVDLLKQQLPRSLIWPTCIATTCVLATAWPMGSAEFEEVARAVMGATVLSTAYLAIAIGSRGGLGAGDVRLAVLVGGLLGWHSWSALATGAALGFMTSAVGAAGHAGIGRRGAIPHGPGMLIGALVPLLF